MPLSTLIARFLSVSWLIIGLSHVLHPRVWTALLLPLRDRDTGGFVIGALSLPLGLVVVLGHNLWVWDLPVIVTVVGWATTIKSVAYLLLPRAHARVMADGARVERGVRVVGAVMFALAAVAAYDAFFRR
jgi:hypothetical protein